jgi:hypothetical protein
MPEHHLNTANAWNNHHSTPVLPVVRINLFVLWWRSGAVRFLPQLTVC